MNIILDSDQVETYRQNYTVLELDTIRFMPENRTVTAYCVLDRIGLSDLPKVEIKSNLHQAMIDAYKVRDWELCEQSLQGLLGFWSGEVDSFYDEISTRVQRLKTQDLGADWDPAIVKTTNTSISS